MPRSKPTVTPTVDEQLMELPPHVRPTAAAARNASLRVKEDHERLLEDSKKLKVHVRKLHVGHEISIYKIARLLGMSETRIRTILDGVRRQK